MISCMLQDGVRFVAVKGTLVDIMSDVTFIVKGVYDELDEKNVDIFKNFVKELLVDLPFYNFYNNDKELEKKTERLVEDKKKEVKEMLSELNDIFVKFNK